MDGLTYNFESWDSFWADCREIVYNEHQPETNLQEEYAGPFDVLMYESLEKIDRLDILVIRDGDTVVGYSVSILMPAPHGILTTMGMMSFYYVRKPYRGKGIGSQLFERAASHLNERGSHRITVSFRAHTPHYKQLRRLGWEPYEVTMIRKY